MTRVMFGISASCFAAKMSVKQNAIDFAHEYPMATKVVERSFYVDDCLTGADDIKTAIMLQQQLQDLFSHSAFLLRKWNSSEPSVLTVISQELHDSKEVHYISCSGDYAKILGLEWNTSMDTFRLTVSKLPLSDVVTK